MTREPSDAPSITCPDCGMTSHHPIDVVQGYCANCKEWTSPGKGVSWSGHTPTGETIKVVDTGDTPS